MRGAEACRLPSLTVPSCLGWTAISLINNAIGKIQTALASRGRPGQRVNFAAIQQHSGPSPALTGPQKDLVGPKGTAKDLIGPNRTASAKIGPSQVRIGTDRPQRKTAESPSSRCSTHGNPTKALKRPLRL